MRSLLKFVFFILVLTVLSLWLLQKRFDPYFYLHLPGAKSWMKPWLDAQTTQTETYFLNQIQSTTSRKYADEVDRLRANYGKSLAVFPRIESVPDTQGCQALLMYELGPKIFSQKMQNLVNGECQQRIYDYKFSDDFSSFAIQLTPWNDVGTSYLVLGRIDLNNFHIESHIEGIFSDFNFLHDGTLLFKNTSSKKADCEIFLSSKQRVTCALSRSRLQEYSYSELISIKRRVSDNALWLLAKSQKENQQGEVLLWDFDNQIITPFNIGGNQILRTEVVEDGLYIEYRSGYSKSGEKLSALAFVNNTAKHVQVLLHSNSSYLSWDVYNNKGRVLIKKSGFDSKYTIYSLNKNVIKQLNLGAEFQIFQDVYLWGNGDWLLQNSAGESLLGYFDELDSFHPRIELKYPFPIKSIRFFGLSSDGTKIPCTKISLADPSVQTGTVIEVYGAYGKPLKFNFNGLHAALLSEGVAIILAHTRGGGEYGQPWHFAGIGDFKMTTILDARACLDAAIENHEAIPGQIIMTGQSAGAVPAINVALDNPKVVNGVWVDVPFLDGANLINNTQIDNVEFGNLFSHTNMWGRRKMSPYHRIFPDGNRTTHFLLTCGEDDENTPWWHCAKTIKALHETHLNKNAFLYMTSGQGHNAGAILSIAEVKKRDLVVSFILNSFRQKH